MAIHQTNALTAATENFEFVDADTLGDSSMDMKQLAFNLDSFKISVEKDMSTVVDTMKSYNERFDAKSTSIDNNLNAVVQNLDTNINTLSKHMAGMESKITRVNDAMDVIKWELKEERRLKTLERAAQMTNNVRSFAYHNGTWVSSGDLAKKVLQYFMLDSGCELPSGATLVNAGSSVNNEDALAAFRDKFTWQIKLLVKREPRLVKKTNGKYDIHYD